MINSDNKEIITLTEEQDMFLKPKIEKCTAYVIVIGIVILQISQQCKRVNPRFKSKDSKLDEIENATKETTKKYLGKFKIDMDGTPKAFFTEDYSTLKQKLSIFPKEYKRIFEMLKSEVQSKTGAFDEKLEDVSVAIDDSRVLAEEIYQFISEFEAENK